MVAESVSGEGGRKIPLSSLPIVEMRGISKYYGGVAALDGVDFSVHAGEVVALLEITGQENQLSCPCQGVGN